MDRNLTITASNLCDTCFFIVVVEAHESHIRRVVSLTQFVKQIEVSKSKRYS